MSGASVVAVVATQLDPASPWPGLESYDEASHEFFSGRRSEAAELERRILDDPMTVLFGKSGLGKTSLLKAGVFPRLRDKGLLPVLVRLQVRPGAAPMMQQVRLAFFEELRLHRIDHPEPHADETLWEYLHRSGRDLWTSRNRLVRPLLVFDQFEELFTLGRSMPAAVEAFRDDLSDLVENRLPPIVAQRLEHAASDLDRLELDVQEMPYKIVLSLREDYLADLEEWRPAMPSLRRNRMRLLPMGPAQALAAVWNERTGHLVSKPLAQTIVDFLSARAAGHSGAHQPDTSGASVEPALLSLFCRGVNEERQRAGADRFDTAMVERAQGTIVGDFYRLSLEDQPERVRHFIEEELITEHGFRNSYSVDDALAQGFLTQREVETLINRHLLRHEHHLGTERLELTHDLLTRAVLDQRDERRRAEVRERERGQRRRLQRLSLAAVVVAAVFAALAFRATRVSLDLERANAGLSVTADWLQAEKENAEVAQAEAQAQTQQAELARAVADEATASAVEQTNLARQEKAQASAERDRSRSRELGAVAEGLTNQDPEAAILLALAGLKRADTAEARTALVNAAQYAWPSARLDRTALKGAPAAIALSTDGSRLAVLTDTPAVTMWDMSARLPRTLWTTAASDCASVAFTPDGALLAVGCSAAVDLLKASTGVLQRSVLNGAPVSDRRIVFSPDGSWLASSTGPNQLQLIEYQREGAMPVAVPAEDAGGFAVLPGGQRLITVSNNPMAAFALDRRGDQWTSTKIDLGACLKLQSISPGPRYFSATWTAGACNLISADASLVEGRRNDTPTSDIVWNPVTGSMVQILLSDDLIVARREGPSLQVQSRIKGARPNEDINEKSRMISVDGRGDRVALIDETGVVRIYSVGEHKPFLAQFERGAKVAVPAHGRWMAIGRAGPGQAIEIVSLQPAEAFGRRTEAPPLGGTLSQLHAVTDAVVAVSEAEPWSTSVIDAVTGRVRFTHDGAGRPLGAAGGLLLISARANEVARIVKVRDGSAVAPWDTRLGGQGPIALRVSASNDVIAVIRQALDAPTADAAIYVVRGEALDYAGQVEGLPASVLGAAASRLAVADDGRTLVEMRTVARDGAAITRTKVVWPVSTAGAPAATATRHDTGSVRGGGDDGSSPSGRFAIHRSEDRPSLYHVLRRGDGVSLGPFRDSGGKHLFSRDDRWLVTWSPSRLQVVDLTRARVAFNFARSRSTRERNNNEPIDGVEFAARDTMLSVGMGGHTMLIPLEDAMMERFARWLVPRSLGSNELCQSIGGDECAQRGLALRRSRSASIAAR